MTLEQLIESLLKLHNDQTKDRTVVVLLHEPSIGPIANTGIKQVQPGFDWEHDMIVITTNDEICHKSKQ